MTTLQKIIQHDKWAFATGENETGPWFVRFRTPVYKPTESNEYIHRLSVLWIYANEDSGELPSPKESNKMEIFENRLCEAWEYDKHAILTAIVTFDGAMQWVFYTKEVHECGKRLNEMPQEKEPYPIELTTEQDKTWDFLHNQVLSGIDWKNL